MFPSSIIPGWYSEESDVLLRFLSCFSVLPDCCLEQAGREDGGKVEGKSDGGGRFDDFGFQSRGNSGGRLAGF